MAKKSLIATLALSFLAAISAVAFAAPAINGAGATFPYPLYAKWTYDYNKQTQLKLNYQSIGSGGGIKQIKAGTVDFGASDAPLSAKELDEAGLMQFPMAIGGVVPVVNIDGVKSGRVKLTPSVLADIYLGKIKKWSDARITAINQGVKLPDERITPVYRADGSGTTWIFTNYLSKVSKDWSDKVGFGTAVKWPEGVGGKGNEGVATYVKRIKNTIGYVEYAFAVQNKLTTISMQGKDTAFVEPSMASFSTAAAGANWKNTPGFSVILTDTDAKGAWPIAGATFIIVHKKPANCENAKAVLDFFDWAYKNGAESAKALDYVPIPKQVYDIMENAWFKEIRCDGMPVSKK
ncbi:phosphate ABC transporter substrate-binding protein PstS [bacterium]|nr:MAG: phosphate ABC transporter substrate-binding protein PstS [bacterium]